MCGRRGNCVFFLPVKCYPRPQCWLKSQTGQCEQTGYPDHHASLLFPLSALCFLITENEEEHETQGSSENTYPDYPDFHARTSPWETEYLLQQSVWTKKWPVICLDHFCPLFSSPNSQEVHHCIKPKSPSLLPSPLVSCLLQRPWINSYYGFQIFKDTYNPSEGNCFQNFYLSLVKTWIPDVFFTTLSFPFWKDDYVKRKKD